MTARVDLPLAGALVAFFALLTVALFGERLAPHEDIYFAVEHQNAPRPYDPGLLFPLGSDILGRDLFSLVLAGAGTTLAIVLLAGVARVLAGLIFATVGAAWAPTRLAADSVAQLVSSIPATVVALIFVKVFVKADTSVMVFVAALLLIGWAGPYRVLRAELDRIARAPFIEGARAIGISEWRLLWRHRLPHIAPALSVNLAQQVIAALVLVAELGVIGVFVGATRQISLEESLTAVRPGELNEGLIADSPEWGGLLATSRTVLALWVTRWLIFLPGAALALTAAAVAVIGFVLARRYARRDLIADLRGRGAAGVVLATLALFIASAVVPGRFAAAAEWASAARAQIGGTTDVEKAFAEGGLRPVGSSYEVTRDVVTVARTAPALVKVGDVELSERWPEPLSHLPDRERLVRSYVSAATGGGGVVEAPMVFAGRGISQADYVPRPQPLLFRQPDFARSIRDFAYADDYAGIDVRGKVVVLVRFLGIRGRDAQPCTPATVRCGGGTGFAEGPLATTSIANAIKRGAAAVIFVDPALYLYNDLAASGTTYGLGELTGGANPYLRAERETPAMSAAGVPVVVLGSETALRLLTPLGIDLAPLLGRDEPGGGLHSVSPSRELGATARVEVPLERRTASAISHVGEVSGIPDSTPRVVIWAPRAADAPNPASDVLAALGRTLTGRRVPFVLVDFDPALDARANARQIAQVLGPRPIGLVVVLDKLDGDALRFVSPYGELIPAIDRYAEEAGARHVKTRATANSASLDGIAPFLLVKTVLVTGTGGDGDLRADAAALLGYLAGRHALGAPELPR